MMTLQKLSSILMKMVWGKFRYVFIPNVWKLALSLSICTLGLQMLFWQAARAQTPVSLDLLGVQGWAGG